MNEKFIKGFSLFLIIATAVAKAYFFVQTLMLYTVFPMTGWQMSIQTIKGNQPFNDMVSQVLTVQPLVLVYFIIGFVFSIFFMKRKNLARKAVIVMISILALVATTCWGYISLLLITGIDDTNDTQTFVMKIIVLLCYTAILCILLLLTFWTIRKLSSRDVKELFQ
ncbi:MAG: hypothetical protein WCM76_11330 [Bacteroidota bacterium]